MNKKVNICFTHFHPIGTRTLQNFYFSIKCEISNVCHKSSIVYGGKPNYQPGKTFFWQIELKNPHKQIICELFLFDQDKSNKTDRLISKVNITTNIIQNQQKQTTFFQDSKKIGILSYAVFQTIQQLKDFSNFFSLQTHSSKNQESSYVSKTNTKRQQIQLTYSQDFQDERYHIDYTSQHSNQSSFIKFDTYSQMTKNHIFQNLDESSIPERHRFENDGSFMTNFQIPQKKQKQLSSLQKWLLKLKNVDMQKNKLKQNVIELSTVIPQKYLEARQNYDAKLNLKYIQINKKNNQNLNFQSLSLNLVDDKDLIYQGQSLFQCNFSLSNQNQSLGLNDSIEKVNFKNLFIQVPSNKNVELKITLTKQTKDKNCQQISGIFIREKILKEEEIPLFASDEKLFGSLKYKAKLIQNASVQCLPAIQQNPVQVTHQNQVFSNFGFSPDKNQSLKKKIRQRKLNNILVRRQVQKEFRIKKYSYDQNQDKQIALYSLNSPTRTKVNHRNLDGSKLSIKQNSQFSSQNQFHRSNTQELPFFQLQNSNEKKQRTNRSQENPNRYRSQNFKLNFLNQSKISEKDQFLSKSSSKIKNEQNFPLRSTNLTNLKEEQSGQQESYLKGDTFNVSSNNPNSPFKKTSLIDSNMPNYKSSIIPYKFIRNQQSVQSQFIIKISSVTVILYQNLSPQEEQNGKFLILKSDKGETFITETLFSNHLNLNWKKKSYQFTSSLIQISLYERTGCSSQCPNKHNFRVIIKFIDLMKAIKQNFYRQQIWVNGQAIGTIVLLYDILMERQKFFSRDDQNMSQIQNKKTIHKRNRTMNKSQMIKKSSTRNQDKSTIKIQSQLKNRRRARTLQSEKNSVFLPLIERSLSRKPKMYEGGKNIKIGRAQRFISYNMAEVSGQI